MNCDDRQAERVLAAYRAALRESQRTRRPASILITIVPPGIVQLFKTVPAGREEEKVEKR